MAPLDTKSLKPDSWELSQTLLPLSSSPTPNPSVCLTSCTFKHIQNMTTLFHFYYWVGQKNSFVFFHYILWKNLNEPFGQPNTIFLFQVTILSHLKVTSLLLLFPFSVHTPHYCHRGQCSINWPYHSSAQNIPTASLVPKNKMQTHYPCIKESPHPDSHLPYPAFLTIVPPSHPKSQPLSMPRSLPFLDLCSQFFPLPGTISQNGHPTSWPQTHVSRRQ